MKDITRLSSSERTEGKRPQLTLNIFDILLLIISRFCVEGMMCVSCGIQEIYWKKCEEKRLIDLAICKIGSS